MLCSGQKEGCVCVGVIVRRGVFTNRDKTELQGEFLCLSSLSPTSNSYFSSFKEVNNQLQYEYQMIKINK